MFPSTPRRRPSAFRSAIDEPAAGAPRYQSVQFGPTREQEQPRRQSSATMLSLSPPQEQRFIASPEWFFSSPQRFAASPQWVPSSPEEQRFVAINPFEAPKRQRSRPAHLASTQQQAVQPQQPAQAQQPAVYPAGGQRAEAGQPFRYPLDTQAVPPPGHPGELHDGWDTSTPTFQPPVMVPIIAGDDIAPPTVIQASRPASRRSRSSSRGRASVTVPHERRASVSHSPARRLRTRSSASTTSTGQLHDVVTAPAEAAVEVELIPGFAILQESSLPEIKRTDTLPQAATSPGTAPILPIQSIPLPGVIEISRPASLGSSRQSKRRRSTLHFFGYAPFIPLNILAKLRAHKSISHLPAPATFNPNLIGGFRETVQYLILFAFLILFDTVPRKLYLHLLLRIPSLYFTRVTRIFEDAQLSLPDIKKMAQARAEQWTSVEQDPRWTTFIQPLPSAPDPLPRSLLIFKSNWESFIGDLMSEWQTLNIVSVLLMSAILTMLQIEAASHPITRTSALFSLICALMSLLYGCIYIIRFGSMRKMHKASSFADEAQKSTTSIWWNVWVLLAMPAVWLAWAMILFFVCIMSFVWLSGSSKDLTTLVLSPRAALGVRIALTSVFFLGLIYLVLMVRTFYHYGDLLDREWMRRVDEWSREIGSVLHPGPSSLPFPPQVPFTATPAGWSQRIPRSTTFKAADSFASVPVQVFARDDEFFEVPSFAPIMTPPSAFLEPAGPAVQQPFGDEPLTLMRLGYHKVEARIWGPWAQMLESSALNRFLLDISNAWNGQLALKQADAVAGDHDAGLPTYTLLPLAPSDTSFHDGASLRPGFVANAFVGGDKTVSDPSSSSGHLGVSITGAAFSALDAPAPGNASAEHGGSTSPMVKTRAYLRLPSRSRLRFSSIVKALAPSRSRSRAHDRRTPSPGRARVSHIAPSGSVHAVREFLALWNERHFRPRNMEVSLVPLEDSTTKLPYAINVEVLPSPTPSTQWPPPGSQLYPEAATPYIPDPIQLPNSAQWFISGFQLYPGATDPYSPDPVQLPSVPASHMFAQDGGFFEVPDLYPITTPPLAFLKPSGPVLEQPAEGESFTFAKLGYHRIETRVWGPWAQTMEGSDLNRFLLDISNAWYGRLALKQADAVTGDHDTGLPIYTLLPPARPVSPSSDGGRGDSVADVFANENKTLSDSSSSSEHVGASTRVTAFSASDALQSGNSSTEHGGSTPPLHEMRALPRSPSGSLRRSSSIVDAHAPSRSRSRSHEHRSPPPSHPSDNYTAPSGSVQVVREFIALWNKRYFHSQNMEALLVPLDHSNTDLAYAINLSVVPSLSEPQNLSSNSVAARVVPNVLANISSDLNPLVSDFSRSSDQ